VQQFWGKALNGKKLTSFIYFRGKSGADRPSGRRREARIRLVILGLTQPALLCLKLSTCPSPSVAKLVLETNNKEIE
jgi:hypothetical protein